MVNHGQNLPRLVNELISLGMVPVSELSYRDNASVECVNCKQHYNIMCDGQQWDVCQIQVNEWMEMRWYVNHGQNLPSLVKEPISLGMVPVSELFV